MEEIEQQSPLATKEISQIKASDYVSAELALERDRISLERERLANEREKLALEREKWKADSHWINHHKKYYASPLASVFLIGMACLLGVLAGLLLYRQPAFRLPAEGQKIILRSEKDGSEKEAYLLFVK